ncbi:MAG: GyrI-like domain-containing protein [Rhizobiaceae bacterium]
MEKTDIKKQLKELYKPTHKNFSIVDVPELQFVMIEGIGKPEGEAYAAAIPWLYSVAYPIKFIAKKKLAKDFVVGPLQGLWWADDMGDFVNGNRDRWRWQMMITLPDWVGEELFEEGVAKASTKLGDRPDSFRLEKFTEGKCVQILHIGSYADEAPTIARMHNEFIPENGLALTGHHHEIYLSDPRRVAPEKLKTILRQPVREV